MPIISKATLKKRWSGRRLTIMDNLTRIALTLITFGIAATSERLDLFVALIGAVKMSALSLMAPAIIDTASNWDDLGKYYWKAVKNGLIFTFGFFGFVVGTWVAAHKL